MTELQSKVILAKGIKTDKNYINVLDYNETQMLELLNSNTHHVASRNNCSFINPNGTIFVDIPYATCLTANYIAFQNRYYANKWFFAWIDEVIFNSDKNAEIRYTIDMWATWRSNWIQKPCFVKREHVLDDTIGANTIDENLNIGEVEQIGPTYVDSSLSRYLYIVIECEWDPETQHHFSGVSLTNGAYHGNKYYFIAYDRENSTTASDYHNLNNFLLCVASGGGGHWVDIALGNIEYIKNIFVIPSACLDTSSLTQVNITAPTVPIIGDKCFDDFSYYKLDGSFFESSFELSVTKQYTFADYTPKNNKCFCYPYNYLYATNLIGNQNVYKYEDFSDTNPSLAKFKFIGAVSVGASGKFYPLNYKSVVDNYDEGLPLGKFPTFSWTGDAFTNWLTQNAVNMATSIVGIGSQGLTQEAQYQLGEVTTSAILGTPVSIASGVMSTIGSFAKATTMPNIQGGQNTGDVMYSAELTNVEFHPMRCKLEYLKRIDDFFSRFGYKIDRVKLANLGGRRLFNYVEIGDHESIGYGDLPSEAMETINNACRKGVTIWHNHANIGNYNLDNSII